MTYLYQLSIGPVQDFIQQARKTHDLYAGSRLLSHLLFAGAKKLVELHSNDNKIIITPYIDEEYFKTKQFDLSIPNVMVAKVEVPGSAANTIAMGSAVENAVREAFVKVSFAALSGQRKPPAYDPQIKGHLSIHWLFEEIKDENYFKSYHALTSNLASIKGIRIYEQYHYQDNGRLIGERGRKCNLDGERNVIIYRKTKKETDEQNDLKRKLHIQKGEFINLDWDDESSQFKIWDIAEGEGLSAVSFTKRRFLSKPHQLPSTARISLMHLFEKIKDWPEFDRLKRGVEGEKSEIWLRHSNDELYYEENINRQVFFKEGDFGNEAVAGEMADEARSVHNQVTVKMKTEDIKEKFCKYYALVASDGDEMGKWLSGNHLTDEQKKEMEAYHRDLTRSLGRYANENSKIRSPFGQSVYTGGEDYLGFFNLYHVITQLEQMYSRYKNFINEPMTRWRNAENRYENNMTLSAGVAIAHYKEPLSQVVKQSHALEKKSKNEGRDRFSIGLMKRSGSYVVCTYKWENNDVNALDQIKIIISELQINFSNSWITGLFSLLELFHGQSLPDYINIEKEIFRFIKRSNHMKKNDGESEENFRTRKENSDKRLNDAIMKMWKYDSAENFRNMLVICDFIARQTHNTEQ